jgi:hypothetical protein
MCCKYIGVAVRVSRLLRPAGRGKAVCEAEAVTVFFIDMPGFRSYSLDTSNDQNSGSKPWGTRFSTGYADKKDTIRGERQT